MSSSGTASDKPIDTTQQIEHDAELDAALDSGIDELPPNVPPGILGEAGFDLRKVDDDGPHGLNAGLIQESTWETTVLWVALAYLIFFPAAFFILWRSDKIPMRGKVIYSVLMVAGIVAFAWWAWGSR